MEICAGGSASKTSTMFWGGNRYFWDSCATSAGATTSRARTTARGRRVENMTAPYEDSVRIVAWGRNGGIGTKRRDRREGRDRQDGQEVPPAFPAHPAHLAGANCAIRSA